MLVAMRNYRMPLMWATVVVILLVALLLYAVTTLIERAATARFQ